MTEPWSNAGPARSPRPPLNRYLLPLCLLALLSATAQAQSTAWKGEGELGLAITSGNTDTRIMNAKLNLTREIRQWRHTGHLELLQSETDGTTSAERYVLAAKSDYALGEALYAFGAFRHENDEFSSFEHQSSLSAGLGDRFIDDGQTTLDLSAGLGLRSSKVRSSGETEEDTILRLGGQLAYRFNEQVAIGEDLLVESGSDNTYVESLTSLTAKVNDKLAAKFGYLVKHNSEVTAGRDKTDTLTTVSLVYSF